ncbi:MAG TPA: phosphoglycerol transferase [Ruminococcus sp.]|nr:phosphoglycerol transferase [Ruminococcus sp.]
MERLRTVLEKIKHFNEIREKNSEKYKMTNLFLMFFFPVFIVSMAEINQSKTVSKFILFLFEKPTVMLFDVLLAGIIFCGLLFIFKKGWIAVTIQSVVYFTLSIVELFKYNTNGNHLILSEMKLFRSVKSLTSFAYIKITPVLVIYTLIVLAYIAAVFVFNPKLKMKMAKRIVPAAACVVSCTVFFAVPSVADPVYSLFSVDSTAANNVFRLNQKFENNSFLAFIVQTFSETISNKIVKPESYSADTIDDLLDVEVEKETNDDFIKPNVIVVMSEAFADFRKFDELDLDTDAYDSYDEVAEEGFKGTAIVPTFASFTVRTEFELLFGLPVKSLNDPNMPQRMLLDREQPTIVQCYDDLGYSTAYVHPFLSSFYSRKRVYSNFGFDTMIFDDSFTVPVEYEGTYISDETVFNQIEKLIKETDKPLYVHTTTMQNHQPYSDGDNTDEELENYLSKIKITSDALKKFTEHLSEIDEPTVVLMIGDHFPSFKAENSAYDKININADNCSSVYEQSYIVWSNYITDYSSMPDEKISTFYLPYVMYNLIDAPKDTFIQAMTDKMQTLPIYSTQYDSDIPHDEELDVLTYDRILGDNISTEEELKND